MSALGKIGPPSGRGEAAGIGRIAVVLGGLAQARRRARALLRTGS